MELKASDVVMVNPIEVVATSNRVTGSAELGLVYQGETLIPIQHWF